MPDSDPNSPQPIELDLASAHRRVSELEAELRECEDELLLKEGEIDDLRIQLELADLILDECGAARRKLQQRVDELEDEFVPPCAVVEKASD
jgi:chromosome segregation ATPase